MIKYLGIDWGAARIGLAQADSETKIATPYLTVKNLAELLNIIVNEDIDKIIIGSPFQISNVEFKTANEFDEFLGELKSKINIPIITIDERLTTKEADAMIGRDKKANAKQDEIAAMLILQTYLDKQINS